MKKVKALQDDVCNEVNSKLLINNLGTSFRKQLKRFAYLLSFVSVGLLFNNCVGGYTAAEPSFVVVTRPPQPSNLHIWIDSDWVWNHRSKTYVQRNGYWKQPKQNRTWVAGYWQTSSRGRYWTAGHWEKQTHKSNNNRGRKRNK